MNVAWMTPFFRDSAVGELGGRVAEALARAGHNVTIIGTGPEPYIQTPLAVISAGSAGHVDADFLNAFDAVVFNVSNHGSSFPTFRSLEEVPGIVVLCDRVYVHSLDAYTRAVGNPMALEAMAQRYYGAEGVDFVRRFRAGAARDDEFERFTFVEPLLTLAQCALVHSHEYRDLVASRWGGPVVRLTGFTVAPPPATAPVPRSGISVDADDFLLAFVGYITPYRSIDVVMQVLRDRPDLAARTKLAIVGRIEDAAYARALQQTAADYGIAAMMRWGFNATDDVKHTVLSNADAAYNCRTLNSEGSSASLLEEMSYGLAVIVNANGFARDIPPDAVYFVDRATMRDDVERVLEEMIADPQRRRAVGERAKAWIATNSSTTTYASTIAGIAEETATVRPANAVKGRLNAVLGQMGATDDSGYGRSLHAVATELLVPKAPYPQPDRAPTGPQFPAVLFVRGCPRSGTTLLADVLNESPEIGLLVEFPFGTFVRQLVPLLWYEQNVQSEVARVNEKKSARSQAADSADASPFFVPLENRERVRFGLRYPTASRFPYIVTAALEASLDKPGLKILGSKTPGAWEEYDLSLVRSYFPQIKYVFVVREPSSTINSVLNRRNFARSGHDDWHFSHVTEAIEAYRESIAQLYSCAQLEPFATLAVGYDDLLARPSETLGKIGAFLRLELDDYSRLIQKDAHSTAVLAPEEEACVAEAFGAAIAAWPLKQLTGLGASVLPQLQDCLTVLDPGREYRFDGNTIDRGLFGSGWSVAKSEYAWTQARVADLHFCVASAGSYAVTLQLEGFVPEGASPLEFTLAFAGQAYSGRFAAARTVTMRCGAVPLQPQTAYTLRFQFSALQSPAALGINQDPRLLGIRLRALWLAPAP